MSIAEIQAKIDRLQNDNEIQNSIAQANARAILFNTSENRQNFPKYNIKDEKLDILAFYYISLGCQLAESQDFEGARLPLEIGAALLENVHSPMDNRKDKSNYYGIISALAFYVSFQYSKSFILINKLSAEKKIASLVSNFLKRDFSTLLRDTHEMSIDEQYSDTFLAEHFDEIETDDKVFEITVARSLYAFVRYLYTGNEEILDDGIGKLEALKEITEISPQPALWWIARLLLLIGRGLRSTSIWKVLNGYFDLSSPVVSSYTKSLLYLPPRGIFEFFITQRKSLGKVLDPETNGSIVSIPTSSGKTRIAELAILDCIEKDSEAKILYIAPFRSLAFEVETSLGRIMRHRSMSVSHLYGGALYSKLDEDLINDSNVIIVTPEKAKAILRGNDELTNQIKLIIVDEGHLLGPSRRLIANEIYYEELRYFIERNQGRFILLSAVLPNSDELAQWLTNSKDTVYKDNWRPSDERFGILEWNGTRVNLDWQSTDTERKSFNNNFIVQRTIPKVGRQKKDRVFPEGPNDAIAATAYKLRTFGPVLIYVGRRDSVFTMAKSYLKCIDQDDAFTWGDSEDWIAFELACNEIYGDDCDWLEYAKQGIICHNADLHSDARLPLERLMRSSKPRVIICTSTLGQGVNLGVSSAIFSTLRQGTGYLSSRDFWNIAGRAGRAFIDNEGKVLVALNANDTPWNVRKKRGIIAEYLDRDNMDLAQSGLLYSINELKTIAGKNGVSFDQLLELVADNNLSSLGEDASAVDAKLDWIDDTILSLHSIFNAEREDETSEWVDDYCRKCLAFIQAATFSAEVAENTVQFFQSRLQGIRKKVGDDRSLWKSVVKSGIPLNTDLEIEGLLPQVRELIDEYLESDGSVNSLIILSTRLETILANVSVLLDEGPAILSPSIDEIRTRWYTGQAMSTIIGLENAESVIARFYTFNLPWLFNGIAKKFRLLENEIYAQIMEQLAVLCESGLPRLESVKIYQAGIRSRTSALEISTFFDDSARSIKDYRNELIREKDFYKYLISATSQQWLDLLSSASNFERVVVSAVPGFQFDIGQSHGAILRPIKVNGRPYLIEENLKAFHDVSAGDVNFDEVCDIPGIYFQYVGRSNNWQMRIENPYVRVI